MPTVTDDFLTAPLGYSVNSLGTVVDGTTVNLDALATGTGQALTVEYTIPPVPADSPDGLWDEITFTYTWESTNVLLTPGTGSGAYDGAWARFHMTTSSTLPISDSVDGPRGDELVTDAAATIGTVSGTATVTYTDIAPGTYRLFVGENNTGDGEALNISVTSGQALEVVPCFARGSLIQSENGPVAIEFLRPGDMILTENGPKPIRWIGSRRFSVDILAAKPNLRPIRIDAGSLGHNMPETVLVVSPQHRVLVRSAIAQRMFGAQQVLVAAKQLLELDGVSVAEDLTEIEYFHLMFDQHEIILSNGAKTESMYAGKQALLAVGDAARDEIFAIFPELRNFPDDVASAALLAPGRKARQLAKRHKQNMQPLVA